MVSVLAHPYLFKGKLKIKVNPPKINIKPQREKLMVKICEEMMRTRKDELEIVFADFS